MSSRTCHSLLRGTATRNAKFGYSFRRRDSLDPAARLVDDLVHLLRGALGARAIGELGRHADGGAARRHGFQHHAARADARILADLDVAELLLRRAVDTAQTPSPPSLALRARTMRDCARSSELCVSAIDALIAMSGTAAFAATHPIQRAWRDIHFASMHVSLNPEQNFAHFGRTELGLPRDSHQPFF